MLCYFLCYFHSSDQASKPALSEASESEFYTMNKGLKVEPDAMKRNVEKTRLGHF